MADLPRDQLDRLIKVLGLLGSSHDGERAAAAERATAILKKHGATWFDVIDRPVAAPPDDDTDAEIDLEVAPDDGMDDAQLCAYATAFLAGDEAGDFELGDTRFIRDLARANYRWTARQRAGFVRSLRRAWWIRRRAMAG
jgi:hypothetical protein